MSDNAHARLSIPPPMPRPKHRNAVWRLFDAPLYRDWLFWMTATWTTFAGFAISSNSTPSQIPVWLNAVLAAAFFGIVCGVLPAWIRLRHRRRRWKQQQDPELATPWAKTALTWLAHAVALMRDVSRDRPPRTASAMHHTSTSATAAGPTRDVVDEPARPATTGSTKMRWDRIDADGFERLLVRLLEQSDVYVRVSRPMNVNAADAGRDIEAYRRANYGLSERHERVIVQAKHWPRRGVGASEIADLVHAKLRLWGGDPIRGLIVATTGSFTKDAVQWVENHNHAGERPDIVLWSSNELESLLHKWPAVGAEFGVIS